jgi:hypothetical protein
MATQLAQVYKQTLVKMLNYVKPGSGWTVDSVHFRRGFNLDSHPGNVLVQPKSVGSSRPGTRPWICASSLLEFYFILEETNQLLYAQQNATVGSHRKCGQSNAMQHDGCSNVPSETNGSSQNRQAVGSTGIHQRSASRMTIGCQKVP